MRAHRGERRARANRQFEAAKVLGYDLHGVRSILRADMVKEFAYRPLQVVRKKNGPPGSFALRGRNRQDWRRFQAAKRLTQEGRIHFAFPV